MTGAEVLLRRGREEGRQEGREEGRAEGRRRLILDLIATKYGPLTDAVVERVNALSPSELDRVGREILTANTLEELRL